MAQISISEIISDVPIWVYVLFFALLYVGIHRCSSRITSIRWLIIIPLLFVFFSFRGVFTLFSFSRLNIFCWILGLFLGLLLGYGQMRNCLIKADRKKHLIQLPGDSSMLVLIIAIFFIEFFVHFAIAAQFAIVELPVFSVLIITASGIMVGFFAGRSGTYLYKYFQVAPCELKQKKI